MKKSPSAIDVEVGKRIRACRRQRRLTLPRLAQGIGITAQQLQKYEKGVNRVTASKLVEIATVLQVEVGAFFDRICPAEASNDNLAASPAFEFTHEALQMTTAFMSIAEPGLRIALLELVQTIARQDADTARSAPAHHVDD
ncbi:MULTISPECIES: helix-turn-helix domain-containing protein [unclassified Sinorhizobium]|uniref:helix-turn-helix domain-containing protein n=1 Tax=unclassified Sinorhizobium TaxID=2613772 RepID=UPI0035242089